MIDLPLDFECYWDKDYKLDKLTTAEYVLDPRFEIIMVSLRTPDGVTHWVSGDANHVRSELLRLVPDWSAVRVVSHNARLEASILEWKLDIKPGSYLCTMVGSRPHLLPYTRSVALGAIAAHLGIGTKGDFIHKTQGKRRTDFTGPELAEYGRYCITDTQLTGGIGRYLADILPLEEQEILDLTIKKFVRPKLRLNREALAARLLDIEVKKEALAGLLESKHGCTVKDIRSRPKFAALLSRHGVEAPKKINKKGNQTYAFAKDDLAFKELLTHSSAAVRELVASKLALSSTQEEARVKRLIVLHGIKDGWLPVPLVYYGAHPGRLAGDDEINLQNLPRVEIKKGVQKGHLRKAIEAPEGYSVVAADFSNIEARIVATLAGEVGLREAFRQGRDVYAEFATDAYGRPINKKDNPIERFVGKTCVLGLNYGLGAPKFHLKMAQEDVLMELVEAQRIVRLYRTKFRGIPNLWRQLEALASMHMLKKDAMYPSELAGAIFAHERIILPNGMPLIYPGLKHNGDGLQFNSRFAGTQSPEFGNKIWGGMFLENFAQALARIIATRAELRLARRGLPAALQVHDELVWVIPNQLVDRCKIVIATEMCTPVGFLPELPIAVEVKHGRTYGDAK